MAKTMPEIRARLKELAWELDCPELSQLADATFRRRCQPVARAKARKVTLEIVQGVRRARENNPGMSQRELGRLFGIDGGRVNEIINGFRDGSTYESRL